MNDNDLTPKYPNVTVKLVGKDSNVFHLIGLVSAELRRRISPEAAKEFVDATTNCHSYDEVLQIIMRTVNVA